MKNFKIDTNLEKLPWHDQNSCIHYILLSNLYFLNQTSPITEEISLDNNYI